MATLARIPFSQSDETVISGLNTWLMIAAVVHFVGAVFAMLGGCLGTVGMGMRLQVSAVGGAIGIVQMLAVAGLGVLLLLEGIAIVRARGALSQIVSTDQNDQQLLSLAFRQMRFFFALELVWFAVNVLVALLAMIVAIVAPELASPFAQPGGPFGGGDFGGTGRGDFGGGFDEGF